MMMSKCLLVLIVCLLVKDSLQTGTCNFTSSMFRPGLMEDVQELLKQEVLRQRYIGESSQYAALSCDEIKEIKPCQEPGFFWVKTNSGINAKIRFCTFLNDTNSWTPVIRLSMQRYNNTCPGGLELVANSGTNNKKLCRSPLFGGGCYSLSLPVGGKQYKWVRGRVIGYQYSSTNAFGDQTSGRTHAASRTSLDDWYVDGVSISHGRPGSRSHVWTYAAGFHLGATNNIEWQCPCSHPAEFNVAQFIPPLVGDSYYCDVGTHGTSGPGSRLVLSNALWDGENCASTTTCCDNPNLPWFETELPNPTTDDIEFRVCRDQDMDNEDIYLEAIELYIR